MPQMWMQSDDGTWETRSLDGDLPLGAVAGERVHAGAPGERSEGAWLVCQHPAHGAQWVLLAAPQARVLLNGSLLPLGISVLRDRDELALDVGQDGWLRPWFFATERLARVEPLPEGVAPNCPRCHDLLGPAQPAVCCPACGVWHHQLADRPCWTYGETCAACHQQPTDLNGTWLWTPDDL